jgi:hypothetical protein
MLPDVKWRHTTVVDGHILYRLAVEAAAHVRRSFLWERLFDHSFLAILAIGMVDTTILLRAMILNVN